MDISELSLAQEQQLPVLKFLKTAMYRFFMTANVPDNLVLSIEYKVDRWPLIERVHKHARTFIK